MNTQTGIALLIVAVAVLSVARRFVSFGRQLMSPTDKQACGHCTGCGVKSPEVVELLPWVNHQTSEK